jgi:hypothetical protein
MDGCGAYAAVLPYRPSGPGHDIEIRAGRMEARRGARAALPRYPAPGHEAVGEDARPAGACRTQRRHQGLSWYAENLAEEWATPRRVPYFFYATDAELIGWAVLVTYLYRRFLQT